MLNRRLDEHRGKLFERIAVMFQDGAVRVDHTRTSVQRKVEEFQANAQVSMDITTIILHPIPYVNLCTTTA